MSNKQRKTMPHHSRRTWIKNSFLSLAGAALLPELRRRYLHLTTGLEGRLEKLTPTDEAYWELVRSQFNFEGQLRYFNNASLGTSPQLVRQATRQLRDTLDDFPSKYGWGAWDEEKENVRRKAADLLGADAEEIALTHNTTEGMNLIASSLDFKAGDEIIMANHEHHTATTPFVYYQEQKRGVKLVRPTLPLLPEDPEELVEVYRQAITPRTKLISVVHLTNTNGMILPIKAISEMAHEHGILVAVDGAQSVGMYDFSLRDLGCDFFATSCHKWLFAPKGTGIFYARKEAQEHLQPLIVCRGDRNRTIRRFENYNTRNLPEVLGLGAALDYHELVGHQAIHNRTYELKRYFRSLIEGDDRFRIKTPASDDLSAGIINVEVVGKKAGEVKEQLFENYHIDTRPMESHDLNGLRIALAIFTTKKDLEYLAEALRGVV